jgi:hypothetical protein
LDVTRSITPLPATLDLDDVRQLNAVAERLRQALRNADTLPELRTYVATLASDLEDVVDVEIGANDGPAPDTVRTYAAPWEGDCAPPTPRASEIGEEYGV